MKITINNKDQTEEEIEVIETCKTTIHLKIITNQEEIEEIEIISNLISGENSSMENIQGDSIIIMDKEGETVREEKMVKEVKEGTGEIIKEVDLEVEDSEEAEVDSIIETIATTKKIKMILINVQIEEVVIETTTTVTTTTTSTEIN